jgi:hypothetical protein
MTICLTSACAVIAIRAALQARMNRHGRAFEHSIHDAERTGQTVADRVGRFIVGGSSLLALAKTWQT